MISFESIFIPANVKYIQGCQSRKSALQHAAELLGEWKRTIDPHLLLEELTSRESQGSTVLEDSLVAIPHCRLAGCIRPIGALFRFEPAVVFANDGPVKFMIVLVVPLEEEESHLEILQRIAQVCLSRKMLNNIFAATTPIQLYDRFITSIRTVSQS